MEARNTSAPDSLSQACLREEQAAQNLKILQTYDREKLLELLHDLTGGIKIGNHAGDVSGPESLQSDDELIDLALSILGGH